MSSRRKKEGERGHKGARESKGSEAAEAARKLLKRLEKFMSAVGGGEGATISSYCHRTSSGGFVNRQVLKRLETLSTLQKDVRQEERTGRAEGRSERLDEQQQQQQVFFKISEKAFGTALVG